MTSKLRPPVKWHGGKSYLWKRITALFPDHQTYLEPFGGAASVLLNKPQAPVEIYNDLDHRITNLFRVLRDYGEELRHLLSLTPYSEVEFKKVDQAADDVIEQARRDFVAWRLSFDGRRGSFSFTLHNSSRGMASVVAGYLSMIDKQLPAIIERLRGVQIVCRPAIEVIRKWDSPGTLIYCDPPYVHETRHPTSRDVYGVEMSDEHHRQLAIVLNQCQSHVILSGYPSALYDELYSSWRTVSISVPNRAGKKVKKARIKEMLWLNW